MDLLPFISIIVSNHQLLKDFKGARKIDYTFPLKEENLDSLSDSESLSIKLGIKNKIFSLKNPDNCLNKLNIDWIHSFFNFHNLGSLTVLKLNQGSFDGSNLLYLHNLNKLKIRLVTLTSNLDFSNCHCLTKLKITSSSFNYKCIKTIPNPSKLSTIYLRDSDIHNFEDLCLSSEFSNVTKLTLMLRINSFDGISKLFSIINLNIFLIKSSDIKDISQLGNIKYLTFQVLSFPENINAIKSPQTLKVLRMASVQQKPEIESNYQSMRILTIFKQIDHLSIRRIYSNDWSPLSTLNNLKSLSISSTNFDNIKYIQSHGIKKIVLINTKVDNNKEFPTVKKFLVKNI